MASFGSGLGFARRPRVSALVFALAVAFAGCDDDEDMDAGVDAGEPRDGAMPVDADGIDGGDDMDGGDDTDGGDDVDGGDGTDAGDGGGGEVGGGAATSAQIAAVRAAPAGAADLPIDDAVVTYVKPDIGGDGDPPGFFLQAEPMGPAIFVRLDPAMPLTPAPEVGQVVDLRATDLADPEENQGRPEIREIAAGSWNVDSSGNDVGFLVQDVSTVDIVDMVDEYALELVSTPFEIRGSFRFAGEGYQQITVDTPGVTGSDAISLRVPETLVSTLNLEPNCQYTILGTPLWRIGGLAQLTVFDAAEIMPGTCAAPVPEIADSLNERTIVIRFSRELDPASVMADGSQFGVVHSGGLIVPVTAAEAGAMYVVVTTGGDLLPDEFYTVTVASTVTDTRGTGVEAAMSSVMFEGYTPHLVINEVDYDQPGTDDAEFVEIHNPGLNPISIADLSISTVNIASDDSGEVSNTVPLVPNSESLTELAGGAYLVLLSESSGAVTVPAGVPTIMLADNLQNGPDGLLLNSATVCHDSVFYEGIPMTPAMLDGCAYESVAGTDEGDLSLSRIPNGSDFDESSLDFELVTPTPGAANEP